MTDTADALIAMFNEGLIPPWKLHHTTETFEHHSGAGTLVPSSPTGVPTQSPWQMAKAEQPRKRDIIAVIDQLASERKCPHCDRDWHERALTRNMWEMYQAGRTDPNYFSREDHSPVLCNGSTFIGPLWPEPVPWGNGPGWHVLGIVGNGSLEFNPPEPLVKTIASVTKMFETLQSITYKLWLPGDDDTRIKVFVPPKHRPVCDDVVVEFGPQNWRYEFVRVPTLKPKHPKLWALIGSNPLAASVWNLWPEFHRIPTPEPRGYDFTEFDNFMPTKYPTKGVTR